MASKKGESRKRKKDAFKEGKPSEIELDDLAGRISAKWERVGRRLGISQDVVEDIGANEKDKAYKMLLHWSKTTESDTPYEDLYNALCHGRVGLDNVAKEFCYAKGPPAIKATKQEEKAESPGVSQETDTTRTPPEAVDEEKKVEVRKGTPSRNELQGLANEIHADGESWMNLGRQLNITEPKITAIDNQNKGLSEKAYKMLLHWKQANASAAKYKVLFEALNKVNRRDLAEAYCCVKED